MSARSVHLSPVATLVGILLGTSALVVSGCGDEQTPSGDPGVAGTVYGPKMGGPLKLSDTEQVLVFGTAAAVSRNGLSHLFMIPHMAATPSFQKAYLSVWVPVSWSPGILDQGTPGLGAHMVFVALDGREYRMEVGGPSAAGSMRLEIARAEPSADGSHFYLSGNLRAVLRNLTAAGGADVSADFLINVR
jgi:hypothetical protein